MEFSIQHSSSSRGGNRPQNRPAHQVCILQTCVPPYRVGFFQELSRRLAGQLVLAAGPFGHHRNPRSEPTPGVTRADVRNWFIGKSLVVQSRLPDALLHASITVVPFNPREVSALWTLVQRSWSGKPVILWGHGLSTRKGSPRWVRSLRRWMAGKANAIVVYSRSARDDLEALGIPAGKLFVAPNAMNLVRIRELAGTASAERRHVMSVGRMVPAKGFDLVLRGFAKARNSLRPDCRLILVGDGEARARLMQQARELGIESRVDFAGEVYDEERLAEYFSQSLLAVQGGAIGLFAIQSLAHGVPLLVPDDEPHGPEADVLVADENCAYFRAGNHESLADGLAQLMAQPARLAEMGEKGRATVMAGGTPDDMCVAFLNAFEFVAAESARTGGVG